VIPFISGFTPPLLNRGEYLDKRFRGPRATGPWGGPSANSRRWARGVWPRGWGWNRLGEVTRPGSGQGGDHHPSRVILAPLPGRGGTWGKAWLSSLGTSRRRGGSPSVGFDPPRATPGIGLHFCLITAYRAQPSVFQPATRGQCVYGRPSFYRGAQRWVGLGEGLLFLDVLGSVRNV